MVAAADLLWYPTCDELPWGQWERGAWTALRFRMETSLSLSRQVAARDRRGTKRDERLVAETRILERVTFSCDGPKRELSRIRQLSQRAIADLDNLGLVDIRVYTSTLLRLSQDATLSGYIGCVLPSLRLALVSANMSLPTGLTRRLASTSATASSSKQRKIVIVGAGFLGDTSAKRPHLEQCLWHIFTSQARTSPKPSSQTLGIRSSSHRGIQRSVRAAL